jgi:hypothetical protein
MVWGGRYVRAFSATKQGTMQLDLDKLSDHQRVDAPERTPHGSGVLA